MLSIERRKDMLNQILLAGTAKVADLAKLYGINEATVRRDLKYLAENYGVNLTYGGAFVDRPNHLVTEINLANKRSEHFEEKQIIAKKAAGLVKNGETIALNAGSSVEYILDYLENITQLNVITLGLNIAAKASAMQGVSVYVPGGKLRNFSGAFFGSDTESFLKRFNVDKCFFGVGAVSLKKGITHPSFEEVDSNKALLAISERKYLVADSSKFDCVSLTHMADLEDFDAFVVDNKFPEAYRNFAVLNNIEII